MTGKATRLLTEAAGLLRGPHRAFLLAFTLSRDGLMTAVERPNMYSYTLTRRSTDHALQSVIGWILRAQRPNGGVSAYYSVLSGYSEAYPEVTGYLIPTLYDFARLRNDQNAIRVAELATNWLLSLQMPSGAFPAGLEKRDGQPSIFNTGQILQGLVRAYAETRNPQILRAGIAAGDWLIGQQKSDGSWSGPGAYQGVAHVYYTMVSWALSELEGHAADSRFSVAAERNLDWVLGHSWSSGWIDGINLQGYPTYLHFIAYVIQGLLECGILCRRNDAVEAAAKSARRLLRRFEIDKRLLGSYEPDFRGGLKFTCVTGNAQMSCIWLQLFQTTGDLRYLNAALKMNEMLKQLLPARGGRGVAGGVAGSYPIWGPYQPLRYISWGSKFFADALMLELRSKQALEVPECAS